MASRNLVSKLTRTGELLNRYGLRGLFEKTLQKSTARRTYSAQEAERAYTEWRKQNVPDASELGLQREVRFADPPFFSVTVPVFNTPESFLHELVQSVLDQTYPHFELCLADGSTDGADRERILRRFGDSRIRYQKLVSNAGISGNTNAALSMARGDFVVLADHDDLLAPHALFVNAASIAADPDTDVLYSDEDKISEDGDRYSDPFFKPDYSPNLLSTSNYICHLLVFRRSLLEKTGLLRSEFDGAQDYDLVLRLSEHARTIRHVPDVLYHWRSSAQSTAGSAQAKSYTHTAGMRALEQALQRRGSHSVRVESSGLENRFLLRYPLPEPAPKVSVIISLAGSAGGQAAFASCAQARYPDLEVIAVGSPHATRLPRRSGPIREIRFVPCDTFNPAVRKNAGAAAASGEILVFLDGNIRMESGDWPERLASQAARKNIGAVGGKIWDRHFRIIEAGLTPHPGDPAGCAHRGLFADHPGSFGRLITGMDVCALSGSCLAVRKDAFTEAGGFCEGSFGLYSGIDFCLRLRNLGYGILYTPDPGMMLDGPSETDEASAQLTSEELGTAGTQWEEKWGSLAFPDPFYSPNLAPGVPGFAAPGYADGAAAYRQSLMRSLD